MLCYNFVGQRGYRLLPPATNHPGHMTSLAKRLPPLTLLQELFYVSETSPSGLRWKNTRTNRVKLDSVAGFKHYTGYWYVNITVDKQLQYPCHRIVYFLQTLEDPFGFDIDHIEGLSKPILLRKATRTQNMQNKSREKISSSKYKGVYWDRQHNKWRVTITKDSKRTCLGRFTDEKEAARCYNEAAIRLFGEFAKLNNVED